MIGWCVVETLSKQEARAETNLSRQGFKTWCPMFRRTRRHARKVDTVLAPLFPGYLFVRLDPDTMPWRSINGTFGVRHLICFDEQPARLPDDFVEALAARADAEGLFDFAEDSLKPGETVRLVGGPFADQVGTLIKLADKERVAVLLDILGRKVVATMDRHTVISAER